MPRASLPGFRPGMRPPDAKPLAVGGSAVLQQMYNRRIGKTAAVDIAHADNSAAAAANIAVDIGDANSSSTSTNIIAIRSSNDCAACRIQSVLRGRRVRRLLGPRTQTSSHQFRSASLAIRVCGANNCVQRGSEAAVAMIEDLASTSCSIGSAPCFEKCGIGPNASCAATRASKPHVRHQLDTPDRIQSMLRSVGITIHPALAEASLLRAKAQKHAEQAEHAQAEASARAALDLIGGILEGSVNALRLRHKLWLLRAAAARALSDDDSDDRQQREWCSTWLVSATVAQEVQDRLCRAHSAGPCKSHAPSVGPRLVPAVLSAAQAHLRLASLCHGDDGDPASEHRRKAKALLQSLTAPPYEPPETRWHRVRAYEKREIKAALDGL